MTKIPDPNALRVTCPKNHYLGSLINLTNQGSKYCSVCQLWYVWEELTFGRKPKAKEAKP